MLTCKKTYRDIPFAHRQHLHESHCSLIHGHNWNISLTFACLALDVKGFVIDFGKLKFLKRWIDKNLDHASLFNQDDPYKDALLNQYGSLFKAYVLSSCSCEGIAEHIYEIFDPMVRNYTSGRVWIIEVEVEEDSKNSATYRPEVKDD